MPHPHTSFVDELTVPAGSAAELGYRWPAEWEPLARVWVTPPHNAETWPGCLPAAQRQFDDFLVELGKVVEVASTTVRGIATNDSWIRDYGPIFVKRSDNAKAAHDFHFNGWGGKYEVRAHDDVVPQHVARELGLPLWIHDEVLEGGSIDVNGRGTVMTTEQCLLNPNRNPQLDRQAIEQLLHQSLGTRHVIWLPGGIVGDDTDGHIDDIARFVAPDTVVAIRAPLDHPDHAMLESNWQALVQARDQHGELLNIIELPVPDLFYYDFPDDDYGPGGHLPVPASYANFLMANNHLFVPVFGQQSDDVALERLSAAMPHWSVMPIRADYLVIGLGSLHCLTMQEVA
jgi:agmatine deiminase